MLSEIPPSALHAPNAPDLAFCQRLIDDHRQTEILLVQLHQALTHATDMQACRAQYQQLQWALQRHYYLEEHAFFPVLNLYRTMILMEVEHDDLLRREEALSQAFEAGLSARGDPALILEAFLALDERLRAHIREEDHGVFPMAARMFEPEEKALVHRKLEEVAARIQDCPPDELPLDRPTPTVTMTKTPLFVPGEKPVMVAHLFDQDHAQLQLIRLQAGAALSAHWSGQHQTLLVVQGQVRFVSQETTLMVTVGEQITLTPRLLFSLEALQDSQILACRVWPKPHFLRQ